MTAGCVNISITRREHVSQSAEQTLVLWQGLVEQGETFPELFKHVTVLWKCPHIVCHELLLISFPLLAVAEVVCLATLIPIGQRALQRGGGEQREGVGRRREDWKEKKTASEGKSKGEVCMEEETVGRREEWGQRGRKRVIMRWEELHKSCQAYKLQRWMWKNISLHRSANSLWEWEEERECFEFSLRGQKRLEKPEWALAQL